MMTSRRFFLWLLACLWLCGCGEAPQPSGDLYVQVLDDMGDPVQGAQVTLYATENDYLQEQNALSGAATDAKGMAIFLNLGKGEYYFSAVRGRDNNLQGKRQVQVITTELGFKNDVTVIIRVSYVAEISAAQGKVWELQDVRLDGNSVAQQPGISCQIGSRRIFYRDGRFGQLDGPQPCTPSMAYQGSWRVAGQGNLFLLERTPGQVANAMLVLFMDEWQLYTQEGAYNYVYEVVE